MKNIREPQWLHSGTYIATWGAGGGSFVKLMSCPQACALRTRDVTVSIGQQVVLWTDTHLSSETSDRHFGSHKRNLKIYQNAFAAWAPPWTPLGNLQRSRPPSYTWRPLPGGQGNGEDMKRRERKEKREAAEGREIRLAPKRVGLVFPAWNAIVPGIVCWQRAWLHPWWLVISQRTWHFHRTTVKQGGVCYFGVWDLLLGDSWLVIRWPDIVVRGPKFYHDSSSSSIFYLLLFSSAALRGRWTELNRNRPHARK